MIFSFLGTTNLHDSQTRFSDEMTIITLLGTTILHDSQTLGVQIVISPFGGLQIYMVLKRCICFFG